MLIERTFYLKNKRAIWKGVTAAFWVVLTNCMFNQITWPRRPCPPGLKVIRAIQSLQLFPLSWRGTASGKTPALVRLLCQRPWCQLTTHFWLSVPLQLPVLPACGLIHAKVILHKVKILCSEAAAIFSSVPYVKWCLAYSSTSWKDLGNNAMQHRLLIVVTVLLLSKM